MIFVRIIREPTSLLDAEMEFQRQVEHAGYTIVSDLQSYWQGNLFRDTKDAVVTANVKKDKHGKL